jgi:hypothetical protein
MMPHFGMTRMTTMLAVSVFPTTNQLNNKTFSTIQRHRKAAIQSWPRFQTESQISSKAETLDRLRRDLSYKSLRLSVSFGVEREQQSQSSVARAKPSIHDAAFWDDD